MLSKNPAEDDVYQLALIISEIKNKRFFDSRIRKETELRTIDNYLRENEFVLEADITYFTGLHDMWDFGGLHTRESGNQISISGTPGYFFDDNNLDDDNGSYQNFVWDYQLLFDSKKPVSLKWQRNIRTGLNHSITKVIESHSVTSNEKHYVTNIFDGINFGFYPNTRTYISFDLSSMIYALSYNEFFPEDQPITLQNVMYSSGYYYISQKLRIGYTIQAMNHLYDIFSKLDYNQNKSNCIFAITMDYSIF